VLTLEQKVQALLNFLNINMLNRLLSMNYSLPQAESRLFKFLGNLKTKSKNMLKGRIDSIHLSDPQRRIEDILIKMFKVGSTNETGQSLFFSN
jgi:hypothetical protein